MSTIAEVRTTTPTSILRLMFIDTHTHGIQIMDNINVVIRVRPLIKKEESSHWTNDKQHISSRDKNFTFDRIFGPQEDNQRVYDEIGRPIVDQVRNMADWMNVFYW